MTHSSSSAGSLKAYTRSKTAKYKPKHGAYGRRIIKTIIRDDREYQLHATKGWRSYRISGGDQ